jgi:hypothetical protein
MLGRRQRSRLHWMMTSTIELLWLLQLFFILHNMALLSPHDLDDHFESLVPRPEGLTMASMTNQAHP